MPAIYNGAMFSLVNSQPIFPRAAACLLVALLAGVFLGLPALGAERASGIVVLDPAQAQEGQKLKSGWRFRVGDDLAWARPGYDDRDWGEVNLPHRWEPSAGEDAGAYSWYRLHIRFSSEPDWLTGQSLALRMGAVLSAYELYAGGKLVGSLGRLPPTPDPAIDYDRHQIISLPASAIDANGELVLALRVWGGEHTVEANWGSGPYRGQFQLGRQDRLLLGMVIDEIPGLLAGVLCFVFGLYHIYIYYRNRHLESFLWFGLTAIVIGVYALSLSQWRYLLGWDFVAYKKIEYAALYLVPPLCLQGVWSLLDRPVGRVLRIYQLSFLLAGAAFLVTPGLEIHWRTLPGWQFWTLPALALTGWRISQSALEGHEEARTLGLGAMLFIAACLHDIAVDQFQLSDPRLLHWGFLVFVAFMAVSLANRMTAALGHLEEEVAQRTAELEQANRRLTEAALVDPLTGLFNRRGFTAEAEVEIKRLFRGGRGFSVILTDVDHFKSINDRYGHACGDHVLARVASLLRDGVRDVDRVARWGGEEFILLLPETGGEGAARVAEKLRERLEEHLFDFQGTRLHISMTFGATEYRRGESLDHCVARADAALYRGKDAGRNRVVLDIERRAAATP
ncbi:diguanylate cyclase [Parahaliea maris]|uniref:diguanylate cyclase n=1 Tax=Parahaliea maris TaxID=2716870 RepID=A0A5C8ZNA1_9GAMM|nr:diguanylate cyclase [Parahaliea maris]TXS89234.1 diguanylate cyclase [Parahaliea maris]